MAAAIPFVMAAMAVMGQLSQAQQAKNQARAEENAHLYNAAVARNESQRALQESTAQQLMQRRKARIVMGQASAAAAQAGTGFDGSTGDVLKQSGTLAELDALNLAYEGEVRSRGFLAQSDLESYYASVARSKAPTGMQTFLKAGYAGVKGYMDAGGTFGGGGVKAPSTILGGYNNSAGNFNTMRYG